MLVIRDIVRNLITTLHFAQKLGLAMPRSKPVNQKFRKDIRLVYLSAYCI